MRSSWVLVASLLSIAPSGPCAQSEEEEEEANGLATEPVGCFSYGYAYDGLLGSVPEQPLAARDALDCQTRCASTAGCEHFGFFSQSNACYFGGATAVLRVSKELGAVAGPSRCGREDPACSSIPDEQFPGSTAEESRSAWQAFQQPSNLQCWPRLRSGYPASCESHTATVLEDTAAGWPGTCRDLLRVKDLRPDETCQQKCIRSPLCAVWQIENVSSGDGSTVCWHGIMGTGCYDQDSSFKPIRAQRIMHGSYRVLMNTMGMQIMSLVSAFDAQSISNQIAASQTCRMVCLSNLLCEFWQYSDQTGCWVQDPIHQRVGYPLVDDGKTMSRSSKASKEFIGGEYIQHNCPGGAPQPLPQEVVLPVGVAPTAQSDRAATTLGSASPATQQDAAAEGVDGFPMWACVLVVLLVCLCGGIIIGAVWLHGKDKVQKRKAARGLKGFGTSASSNGASQGGGGAAVAAPAGAEPAASPYSSPNSSFEAMQPLVHPYLQGRYTQPTLQQYNAFPPTAPSMMPVGTRWDGFGGSY